MGIKTTTWLFPESPVQCFDWNTWQMTELTQIMTRCVGILVLHLHHKVKPKTFWWSICEEKITLVNASLETTPNMHVSMKRASKLRLHGHFGLGKVTAGSLLKGSGVFVSVLGISTFDT